MTNKTPKQIQRIAYTYNPNEGDSTSDELESFLMVGDPDYDDYKCEAVPKLLEQGYTVNTVKGTGDGNWLFVFDCPGD